MTTRPRCPPRCRCVCHDMGGETAMHLPGVKGCPGKHGYVMNDRDEWIKEDPR